MRLQVGGGGLVAQNQSALAPFRLYRPTTIAEASGVLEREPEAVLAAGCSDLFARFREGLSPAALVSLQSVPELTSIVHSGGVLRIGSMVTHHRGATDPVVAEAVPGLAAAWSSVATVRIRYTATVGGNLMAGRTRYEMSLLLGALGAAAIFSNGSVRAVDDLWREGGGVTGAATSLLTEIAVPTGDLVWFGYERSMRPTATLALAVRRSGGGTLRVRAVAGSEYRPGFVLEADTGAASLAELDTASIGAELAAGLPDSCADDTGSAEYRRHLTNVLAGRLLAAALAPVRPEGEGR